MTASPNTQAVLLLTAHFSRASGGSAKPLTPKEWGRFAVWLKEQDLTPEQLMTNRPSDLLDGWIDRHITVERLEALLNRGSALALATERWLRAGLWVMTRSDADYPRRLKRRLGTDSPAALFGCGNRTLLNSGGLAVVGSRNASDDDLQYARQLAASVAAQGHTVVSGGARGVDESAMSGALESEGTVIGVLSYGLLRASASSKYRRHLMCDNLVLISTCHPEVGFSAGNAMQRNKYIYCLSDAALVVHSGTKGGTWSGATENLKMRWTPLWVKPTVDTASGNGNLVRQGAGWTADRANGVVVSDLFSEADESSSTKTDPLPEKEPAEPSLAEAPDEGPKQREGKYRPASGNGREQPDIPDVPRTCTMKSQEEFDRTKALAEARTAPVIQNGRPSSEHEAVARPNAQQTIYEFFLQELSKVCSASPASPDDLINVLDLTKTQTNAWLKRAESEKKVRKLNRPVRYEWIEQHSLFKGHAESE